MANSSYLLYFFFLAALSPYSVAIFLTLKQKASIASVASVFHAGHVCSAPNQVGLRESRIILACQRDQGGVSPSDRRVFMLHWNGLFFSPYL